jgi:hypothetical protein
MTPSMTWQPAMAPIFGTLKTSRTSAWPQLLLAEDGLEQTDHGLADVVHEIVDHGVEPDVHLLGIGQIPGGALGPDGEADDDGVGRRWPASRRWS